MLNFYHKWTSISNKLFYATKSIFYDVIYPCISAVQISTQQYVVVIADGPGAEVQSGAGDGSWPWPCGEVHEERVLPTRAIERGHGHDPGAQLLQGDPLPRTPIRGMVAAGGGGGRRRVGRVPQRRDFPRHRPQGRHLHPGNAINNKQFFLLYCRLPLLCFQRQLSYLNP